MSDPDVEMFNHNLMKALVSENDKMRAEIERLHRVIARHHTEAVGMRAEIERLRHENMRLSTANEYAFGPAGELAKCRAETERLRGIVEFCETASRHQREGHQAEIERLKAALREALTAWQENRNLNEDQIRAALEGQWNDWSDVRNALEGKP